MQRAFRWAVGACACGLLGAAEPMAGQLIELECDLAPAPVRFAAARSRLPETRVRVVIALPAASEPGEPRSIAIVNATTEPGRRSSRRLATAYASAGNAAGWVVIGADPVERISQADDDVFFRLALARSALAALEQRLPASHSWPIALAGFSGGAKISGYLAALLTREGRRPIGVFQAGVNEETVAHAARQFRVLNAPFRQTPVFLLSGHEDRVALPRHHEQVKAALEKAGFIHVRLETFAGAHVVAPLPLRTALEWFAELERARRGEPQVLGPSMVGLLCTGTGTDFDCQK